MTVLLGGRATERLIFEEGSTGAADDFAKVTDIARSMVVGYATLLLERETLDEDDLKAFAPRIRAASLPGRRQRRRR